MNIIDAMYYQTLSPEKLSELILDIIKGFEDTNIRKINYYDIFLIIPYYTYTPVKDVFERIKFNSNISFQNKVERNPQLCANFEYRYKEVSKYIKKALLYMISNGIVKIDNNLILTSKNKISINNKAIYNIARIFSIKQTALLYSFLKVDIDDI